MATHDPRSIFPQSIAVSLVKSLGPALALLLVFVWAYTTAFHQPQPHDLPLGVVAPTAESANLHSGLSSHVPGVFHIEQYASVGDAQNAVRNGVLDGAVVVGRGTALIVVAGAGGEASKVVIISALSALARSAHLRVSVRDVRPLPPHDPQGLSGFFVVFGLVVASLVFGALLYAQGSQLALSVRLSALATYAVLAAIGTALVVDPFLGALTGHFWQVAIVAGLLALAVSVTTTAFVDLLGLPGISLAALLLIILGNSTSGGPVPYRFLPDGLREISQYLPSGAGVTALRHAVYFGGDGMSRPISVLATWVVIGLAMLIATGLLRRTGGMGAGRAESRGSTAA